MRCALQPLLQMRAELWLSQLHRKEAGHGAFHSAGEYYDLLFEVCNDNGGHWWHKRLPGCLPAGQPPTSTAQVPVQQDLTTAIA
jgi:hypothetical protein